VHVGRHLVAGREFEPEHEWFRFVRIAIQNRDLRPLREYRLRGAPFEAIRLHNHMLVIGDRGSRRENRNRQSCDQAEPVHEDASSALVSFPYRLITN
jgi:hypothetical protein